jgi:hypothetical protein
MDAWERRKGERAGDPTAPPTVETPNRYNVGA